MQQQQQQQLQQQQLQMKQHQLQLAFQQQLLNQSSPQPSPGRVQNGMPAVSALGPSQQQQLQMQHLQLLQQHMQQQMLLQGSSAATPGFSLRSPAMSNNLASGLSGFQTLAGVSGLTATTNGSAATTNSTLSITNPLVDTSGSVNSTTVNPTSQPASTLFNPALLQSSVLGNQQGLAIAAKNNPLNSSSFIATSNPNDTSTTAAMTATQQNMDITNLQQISMQLQALLFSHQQHAAATGLPMQLTAGQQQLYKQYLTLQKRVQQAAIAQGQLQQLSPLQQSSTSQLQSGSTFLNQQQHQQALLQLQLQQQQIQLQQNAILGTANATTNQQLSLLGQVSSAPSLLSNGQLSNPGSPMIRSNAAHLHNPALGIAGRNSSVNQKQFLQLQHQHQIQLQQQQQAHQLAQQQLAAQNVLSSATNFPSVTQATQQNIAMYMQQLRQIEEGLGKADMDNPTREKLMAFKSNLEKEIFNWRRQLASGAAVSVSTSTASGVSTGSIQPVMVNGSAALNASTSRGQTNASTVATGSPQYRSDNASVLLPGTSNGPPKGSPLFPIAPQQSTRIFSPQPLHGLIDTLSMGASTALSTSTSSMNVFQQSGNMHHSTALTTAPLMALFRPGIDDGITSSALPYGRHKDHFLDTMCRHRQQTNVFIPALGRKRKRQLHALVSQIDPEYKLDMEMRQFILRIADNFIEKVAYRACKAAKHRVSTCMDVQDVQLELEWNWNLRIPGYTTESYSGNGRPFRKIGSTNAHQARVAQIQRAKREHQHNLIMRMIAANKEGEEAVVKEAEIAAEKQRIVEAKQAAEEAKIKLEETTKDAVKEETIQQESCTTTDEPHSMNHTKPSQSDSDDVVIPPCTHSKLDHSTFNADSVMTAAIEDTQITDAVSLDVVPPTPAVEDMTHIANGVALNNALTTNRLDSHGDAVYTTDSKDISPIDADTLESAIEKPASDACTHQTTDVILCTDADVTIDAAMDIKMTLPTNDESCMGTIIGDVANSGSCNSSLSHNGSYIDVRVSDPSMTESTAMNVEGEDDEFDMDEQVVDTVIQSCDNSNVDSDSQCQADQDLGDKESEGDQDAEVDDEMEVGVYVDGESDDAPTGYFETVGADNNETDFADEHDTPDNDEDGEVDEVEEDLLDEEGEVEAEDDEE
ncbi:hypothetical protein BDV3_004120 [Batrachochytrium dendrobatidis]|nr:hypothetical protein BDEG_22556 [Batrachochytrium dendrobatidis JEL423]